MSRMRNEFQWHEAGGGRTKDETTTTTEESPHPPAVEKSDEEPQYYYGGPVVEQKNYYTGEGIVLRGDVARVVKTDPKLTDRERGAAVVNDILNHPELHQKMLELGWVQGGTGYSDEMVEALSEFYHMDLAKLCPKKQPKRKHN